MKVYSEATTLSDSYIYSGFNNDLAMTKRIAEAIKTGLMLDSSYIQEQIMQMRRTRLSPLVDNVLNAFENGTLLLIYSKSVNVPKAIPFVVLKMGGKNKVAVFVNHYGSISDTGVVSGGKSFTAPMKDLYVLMEGAFIAWSYYEYPTKFQRSMGLMKLTNLIYTSMIIRILNREYSLSLDQDLYNKVAFCVSRFYLERIWGSDNPNIIFNYALQNCTNMTNRSVMTLVNDEYSQAKIEDINQLIAFIKTLSPKFDKLNTRYFLECYINLYREQAVFSMDTFPYFIFAIAATYCGSFIVKQEVINDIIKNTKSANIFYSELAKLV